MLDKIELRGICLPYDVIGYSHRGAVSYSRYAFSDVMDGNLIPLQYAHHDGFEFCNSAQVFRTDVGLGFRAFVDVGAELMLNDIRRDLRCSIGCLHDSEKSLFMENGEPYSHVIRGSIDHIAMVTKPVFTETRAWVANDESGFIGRLYNYCDAWHRGYERAMTSLARSEAQSAVAVRNTDRARAGLPFTAAAPKHQPAARTSRRAGKPTVPASVIALFESGSIDAGRKETESYFKYAGWMKDMKCRSRQTRQAPSDKLYLGK